jgi:putative drug exporter of the RND superfamily
MARWTRFVLRHRRAVVVFWAAVFVAGGIASVRIAPLLSNTFSVPGTDSERARTILQDHFGQRPDGTFTMVFRVERPNPAALARAQRALVLGARTVRTGRAGRAVVAGPHVIYGEVTSELDLAQAKKPTDTLLAVARSVGPRGTAYVTGAGPIQHDLDPIFTQDLRKGESIAVPIALLVLLGVFGISVAVTMPFIFAACTITGATGIMYGVAQLAATPTYVTNLIQLIGLGIAVDYSLLVVYRFREELAKGIDKEEAVVRTMETAGRAVIFSGATVAIGLLLLVAMPLPFMRLMGIAGFLIPVVSIAAAATLQPVLLFAYGRRGTSRKRILPGEPIDPDHGFWARLARSIMHRPLAYLALGAVLLLSAAVPAFWLATTPGSSFGIPRKPQAIAGFDVLRKAVGAGAVAPTEVVVDSGRVGGARAPAVQGALERLRARLAADPEVASVRGGPLLDRTGRYALLVSFGKHDYGEPQEQAFAKRLRGKLVPAARFPESADVLAGGAPPQGVDFLHQAFTLFPWLILGVLILTYLLLMRAFRSLLLPLKAIILNLLSVGASYGMLVVVFKWGLGHSLLGGLYKFGQVEGWIPIFLFAMLFGLSMDYEVFLVTRMREAWDEGSDNTTAVAHGLERTGRIITAAAVIMVAAFSGFVAGRIVGLQEFGVGLAVAVFVDATVVRSLLVPSLMAIFGRWNWWLPAWPARLVRVDPSPATRGEAAAVDSPRASVIG